MNKLSCLEDAKCYLEKAIGQLENCQDTNTTDAQYFISQIKQVISCDHGEAGLEAWINNIRNAQ